MCAKGWPLSRRGAAQRGGGHGSLSYRILISILIHFHVLICRKLTLWRHFARIRERKQNQRVKGYILMGINKSLNIY